MFKIIKNRGNKKGNKVINMDNILNFFQDLMDKLGEDFTYKNINSEEVPIEDYQNKDIPFDRVVNDRKKCIELVENFFNIEKNSVQRELVLAVYCNFYIKYGMAGRFEEEKQEDRYDGLGHIFNQLSKKEEYFIDLYKYIKNQEFYGFNKILEINQESIVAKIYKFVKICFRYCKEIADKSDIEVIEVDNYKEMWELYESIPLPWREYVIGEGELVKKSFNYADNRNLLPYIDFVSTKDIIMEYIPYYYSAILEKLGIDNMIDPASAYAEIINKIGLGAIWDFIEKEIVIKSKNILQDSGEGVVEVMINCFQGLLELVLENATQLENANSEMDITFLVEKIHWLNYLRSDNKEESWLEGKEGLSEHAFNEMSPVMRNFYLHIPAQGEIKRPLFLSQYNVFLRNRALKKNAAQKKEMMDYYAHSWKHISYPQIVKEIAEELGNSNRIVANRLMKVYNSERTLQRGIQLLQYISSDDEEKVSKEFKNGIAKSGVNSEKVVSLYKVICDSLDLVIFKILMVESDDSNSIEKCREKWQKKKSLYDLREEYTEKFLGSCNDTEKIISWVDSNLIDIEIDIDSEWEQVRFQDDSFAVNQFKEILVEIFTNVFLHGEGYIKLKFASNNCEMLIKEENICSNSIAGSRSGISTMQRVLEYINIGTDISCIDTKISDIFEIIIRINKKILIRKGR